MKVIVGLGNPGFKYKHTRHNIGFTVVDHLAKRLQLSLKKNKWQGRSANTFVAGSKVALLQPMTYMNASGEAIRPFLDYYDMTVDDMLVIYDDLDLPTGKIRLRMKGGTGGHNGMKSIVQHVGTKDFKRLRIGINHPETTYDTIDHVLRPFAKDEKSVITSAVNQAADACEDWLSTPFLEIMNDYNQS